MKDILLDSELDIKDLGDSKEVPDEQPFDAEKEFGNEDWQNIISAFMDNADRSQRDSEARARAIRLGFSLKVLSPNRFEEMLKRKKGYFEEKLQWFGAKHAFMHPLGLHDFVVASKYRLMFGIKRSFLERDAYKVLNDLVPYEGSLYGMPMKSLNIVFTQRVLFPNYARAPYHSNVLRVCTTGDRLGLLRVNALRDLKRAGDYAEFAELAAMARLCFCEDYKAYENPLGLDSKDWAGMRQALRILRVRVPGELVVFAERAAYMQILAAQDVYFGARRIKLGPVIPQESLATKDIQAIPQVRSYQ